VKALKEVVVLRTRLQSHQVHLTMLQYYNIQWYTKYRTTDVHIRLPHGQCVLSGHDAG